MAYFDNHNDSAATVDAAAVTLLLSALPQSGADPSLFLRRSNPPFHTFENLSPRSRAHSIASSLSTASSSRSNYAEDKRDSSAHARPSDKYASAALYPGADGSGFMVEVPGSGQWPVSWNSLMELLLNPQSTAALPQGHPIAEAAAALSASSLRDFAGANGRMSTGVESNKGQLFRIPSGTDASEVFEKAEDGKVPMEVLTFWPGSYYKVTLDDLEILPCDNNRRVNEWLKGQTCEASCTFRIEGKRPSVIRQHIVSCKVRAAKFVNGDPLKRLCQLQLDAQYKPAMSNKPRRASQPPDRRRSADWADIPPAYNSDAEDDNVDRRSIISFGSSLGDPDGAGTKPSTGCSAASLCGGEGNSEQAFQAFIASSSSTSGDPSSQALGPGGMLPFVEGSWLVGYGLSVPTGQPAQFSHGTVVDRSATTAISSSFLSMDE
ncbi:hypothetical protein JCM1840_006535 [Sporobolomyces johnsonii]